MASAGQVRVEVSMSELLQQLTHFAVVVLATAIALLLIAIVLIAVRRFWTGPVEPVGLPGLADSGEGQIESGRLSVNVEYRDKLGVPMNLGPLVKVHLRNGQGTSFELIEGCFVECDPKLIKASAPCTVSVADGRVTEPLWVQVDPQRQTLFVRSQYTLTEMFDLINRGSSEEGVGNKF